MLCTRLLVVQQLKVRNLGQAAIKWFIDAFINFVRVGQCTFDPKFLNGTIHWRFRGTWIKMPLIEARKANFQAFPLCYMVFHLPHCDTFQASMNWSPPSSLSLVEAISFVTFQSSCPYLSGCWRIGFEKRQKLVVKASNLRREENFQRFHLSSLIECEAPFHSLVLAGVVAESSRQTLAVSFP